LKEKLFEDHGWSENNTQKSCFLLHGLSINGVSTGIKIPPQKVFKVISLGIYIE